MSFKLAKLKVLMQEMALLTEPECTTVCHRPHSCCDPMYCAITAQYALDVHGVVLEPQGHDPNLPFMGPTGCVVEPYLRPMCTVHTCEINSFAFKLKKPAEQLGKYVALTMDTEWTDEYFDLRERLDGLMFEIENERLTANGENTIQA